MPLNEQDLAFQRRNILRYALGESVKNSSDWCHHNANFMSGVDVRLAWLLRDIEESYIALRTYADSVKKTEGLE